MLLLLSSDLVNSGQIVEFIAVLLRANSEGARLELIKSGAIQLVLKLFFEYVHHSF